MRTSLTRDGFAECAGGTSEAARRKEQGMSADVWSLGCTVIEMFTGRALKSDFKSPEGRYKLQYEKTHPAGLLHYSHRKSMSQLIIAYLKEKSASQGPSAPSTPSSSSVVKSAAARLFVGVNGSKTFSYGGTNGGSKVASGTSKFGGTFGAGSSSSSVAFNYDDGKVAYLIFNAGDTLFISDLNSQFNLFTLIRSRPIHFSSSNPLRHLFDSEAKYGHDLLIGLQSGDSEWKVNICIHLFCIIAQHLVRCTCVAWVPDGDDIFVVAHADGNLYVYEKSKDGAVDPSFPAIKDPTQFTVAHARSSKGGLGLKIGESSKASRVPAPSPANPHRLPSDHSRTSTQSPTFTGLQSYLRQTTAPPLITVRLSPSRRPSLDFNMTVVGPLPECRPSSDHRPAADHCWTSARRQTSTCRWIFAHPQTSALSSDFRRTSTRRQTSSHHLTFNLCRAPTTVLPTSSVDYNPSNLFRRL
ncbi:hypothetical protein KFK09_013344 [Dendrobium nobile]|uniref:Protein kinase domain-containing protein n=1 Tax=Dendrobium nobile TaxID=94219 RepID=A0A8T3B9B8_DENNO|nr:hypothetical protein KFK09_013344 [Dendrobium nobile]